MSYSPGAVAGIAIGCVFAGAAIVSVIFFFFFRQKSTDRRRPTDYNQPIRRLQPSPEPFEYQFTPRSKVVIDQLPQVGSAAHSSLKEAFSILETRIGNFVYNYVHERPITAKTVDTDKLHRVLGNGADAWSSPQWSTHLCGTTNRAAVLKSYIARVLCARIDPKGDPEKTLLPVDVLRLYQATFPENINDRTQQLVDYWRIISAALLKQQYPLDDLGERDPRFDNINKTCVELRDSLRPFLNERPEEEISQHLREIVENFAKEGYRHFFQTNLTEIVWPPHSSAMVVLFPKLVSDFFTSVGPRKDGVVRVTIKDASLEPLYDSNLDPIKD